MSEPEETVATSFALQKNLTGEAASELADDLMGLEPSAIALNASEVDRLDTPAVQVLVSASKLWADRNEAFEIIEPSEVVTAAFNQLGLEAYLNGGN